MNHLKIYRAFTILLLGILPLITAATITAQTDPNCDIVALKADYIARLEDTKNAADIAEFYSELTDELSVCGYLPGQITSDESLWQIRYEAGNPWIRQCPDEQEIAYPAYEITITREGETLSNGSGGELDHTHDGVYVLTAPYSLRNSTIITEWWKVIDEQTITGTSWDYYPELNCLLETSFELHRQDR